MKDALVQMRISEQDKTRFSKLAADMGISLSEFFVELGMVAMMNAGDLVEVTREYGSREAFLRLAHGDYRMMGTAPAN